jgi:hypothetical protein
MSENTAEIAADPCETCGAPVVVVKDEPYCTADLVACVRTYNETQRELRRRVTPPDVTNAKESE